MPISRIRRVTRLRSTLCPEEGLFQMQLVDQPHPIEIGLLHGRALAVRRRARQAQ